MCRATIAEVRNVLCTHRLVHSSREFAKVKAIFTVGIELALLRGAYLALKR
ncbi:hypothetical protein K239x_33230 [Planctomycetes bacterium K23_9]|uniref:Transposase DDE domain-containing protein n=1 Tax=Stieleria marina TaxID=1930275 RepID=A0A517NW50_9BACT|nr:hypothetical protein K239x_33230 [Planctomycetes bacterium K23_9]